MFRGPHKGIDFRLTGCGCEKKIDPVRHWTVSFRFCLYFSFMGSIRHCPLDDSEGFVLQDLSSEICRGRNGAVYTMGYQAAQDCFVRTRRGSPFRCWSDAAGHIPKSAGRSFYFGLVIRGGIRVCSFRSPFPTVSDPGGGVCFQSRSLFNDVPAGQEPG